ncbi:MAG: hypothetical protein QOH71_630 [Blastocatellia bacterium]|nr:hypothetical protein [Blastocatellia bacterium]
MTSSDNLAPKTAVEQAQLEKLELEIAALKRTESFDAETKEEKRKKMYYETQSARWQTSLIYRASQFATIITIFATAFGIWSAYNKLVTDRQNEYEQKSKDRTDRMTLRYRTDLQQLLEYPIDPRQTISKAVFTLQDLTDVVNNGFESELEKQQKADEVGFLIAQLVKSSDFDLMLTRNSNFDRKAIDSSKFYENYLVTHPMDNRDILSKYKGVLLALHDKDPSYCENFQVDPNDSSSFTESQISTDQTKFFQYVYLFHAYRNHVELLSHSAFVSQPDPHVADYLDLAFCWFWGSSRNTSLIQAIFGGTDDQINVKSSECDYMTSNTQREKQDPNSKKALKVSTRAPR